MKKSIIIFGILIAFVLMAALPGQAQRSWRQGIRPAYGMNLTEEQLARIQDVRLEFQKTCLPLRTQLQTLYLELRSLSLEGAEQAKMDAKTEQIDKLEMEMEKMFTAHQNQIRDLLTDEQKTVFDQWGGLGLGMRGMGIGMGLGMGYGRGFGRAWDRGFGQGWGRGMGRAWARGPGMGRGYWCPWYQQKRPRSPWNWRKN
jgi:Spy/CpxP family protein refolding chaperone